MVYKGKVGDMSSLGSLQIFWIRKDIHHEGRQTKQLEADIKAGDQDPHRPMGQEMAQQVKALTPNPIT